MRQDCVARPHDSSRYYKRDGWAQAIARHFVFEHATLLVIVINCIWIAIETDHNNAELLVDADVGFQLAENFFCAFFVADILIRFVAFEHKSNCLYDICFVFDAVLVAMMVLETWVFFLVGMVINISIGNISVLRIVRLFRLARMARMARLLRSAPELLILIKGLAAAARSVLTTLVLLFLLLYIFGIAFTQVLRSTDAGLRFFPNVIESMHTLWIYATLLNEVSYLAREIRESSPFSLALLDVFILAASLTVLNMLIGVLCAVVNTIATKEKETAALNFVRVRIEQVFHSLGIDPEADCVSKELFQTLIEYPDCVKAINDLGVNVIQLLDMSDYIFQSEDTDGDFESLDKNLSFEEFIEKITELRGSNFATVKDIMQLRAYIRREICKSLHHQKSYLDHCIEDESLVGARLSRMSKVSSSSSFQMCAQGSMASSGSVTLQVPHWSSDSARSPDPAACP